MFNSYDYIILSKLLDEDRFSWYIRKVQALKLVSGYGI